MSVVFQTDSKIVNDIYSNKDNYNIEFDHSNKNNYCVLYFSSNFIYFPNNAESFTKSIVEENRYEWTNQKFIFAHKHIFLRDIKKQWYLTGVNHKLNSPSSLLEFLKSETANYKIITIGSSAGGYAAVLYGQLLNAEKTYCFNAQFELLSLLKNSNESIDPIIFRHRQDVCLLPYYDLRNFIHNPSSVYYFISLYSSWDNSEYDHVKDLGMKTILFKTAHHGVPFPRVALKKLFESNFDEIYHIINKPINPIIFSIQIVGFFSTFSFLLKVIVDKILK